MKIDAIKLKRFLMVLFLVLLVAICIPIVLAWRQGHFESVESFQAYISSFGAAGPLMLTLIQAIQVILPILPGGVGCVAGTVLFGPFISFWCNYIGISGGSITAFYLAWFYGVALVEQFIPLEKYQRLIDWINKRSHYTILFLLSILLPLAPDDFLCYFSGLAKMDQKKFNLIIILAKPWCILAYCYGAGLFLH